CGRRRRIRPGRVILRIESRRNPSARTVSQVAFVIGLKLLIRQQPVRFDPIVITRNIHVALFSELRKRAGMPNRIGRFFSAQHQKAEQRRHRDNQQSRRQRSPPRAKVPSAEQHQQRQHRSREKENENENEQEPGLLVRQQWIPLFRHGHEADKEQRQEPDERQRELLANYKQQEN